MPSFPKPGFDPWWLLLLAVGSVLLLANLGEGSGRLWQDEAETAVLGKNTLRFGYPRAFDGVNRVNPALKVAAGEAWTYHPWLSFYAAAGSFALLGATTFAARLPFALMGLASVLLFYGLVRQMTEDRSLARWASLLLLTSVPFLLHMRQCRYYAPSVLFSLWAVGAYLRFCGGRPWSVWEFAAAWVLLFHANHGAFVPVAGALAAHFLFTRRPREGPSWSRILAVAGATLALTAPFALFLSAGQHHAETTWKEVSHHAQFYFRQINKFVLPAAPWAILLLLWRPRPGELFGEKGTPRRRAFGLAAWIAAVGFLFLVFGPWQRHFRYLVFLLPWLVLVQAALLSGLFRRNRAAGAMALAVFALTDLHYTGPSAIAAQLPAIRAELSSPDARPRCLLLEFARELVGEYRGPMDGVVELLQRRGRPGQTVKIPYDDHTVLFYTGLVLDPVVQPDDFLRETYPDWIVLRKDWIPGSFWGSPYHETIRRTYREHTLDAPDIPWQNRPDPGYHRFQTDRSAPLVVVYEKETA